MGKYPDFLIVGAHKSATTTVHETLSKVQGIFMPNEKEPRYFALKDDNLDYRGINDPSAICPHKDLTTYLSLFDDAKEDDILGEASTLYLYDARASKNIHSAIPNCKIIAILRDPIKRAFSNYNYSKMLGREPSDDFIDSLKKENKRIKLKWGPFWHYKSKGLYGEQLHRYYELFPKDNIKIILYEDLIEDYQGQIKEILRFLKIEDGKEIIQPHRANQTFVPKNPILGYLIRNKKYLKKIVPKFLKKKTKRLVKGRENNKLYKAPEKITNQEIQFLKESFKEDRQKIESILGYEINKWL